MEVRRGASIAGPARSLLVGFALALGLLLVVQAVAVAGAQA